MNEFAQVVEKRRSVRLFDGQRVPGDVVERCLDLAMKSASSSNFQPWEFYWVCSPDARQEVKKICLSQAAANTAGELIVCVARTRAWDKVRVHTLEQLRRYKSEGFHVPESAIEYYAHLSQKMYTLGWMSWVKRLYFLIQGMKSPTMRPPVSEHEMEVWAVKSTALACQTLMLAFQAEGYDTCPMEGFDQKRLQRFLKLPQDAYPVMVLAAGKARTDTKLLPRIRAERSWFVKVV